MTTYILTNRLDSACNAKVTQYFQEHHDDIEVLDFHRPSDLSKWLSFGGSICIAAFPSIVFDHNEYNDVIDFGDGTVSITHEKGQRVMRQPASMTDALNEKKIIMVKSLLTVMEIVNGLLEGNNE